MTFSECFEKPWITKPIIAIIKTAYGFLGIKDEPIIHIGNDEMLQGVGLLFEIVKNRLLKDFTDQPYFGGHFRYEQGIK
uniref:hypothetical protein n=1 Tax=Rhodohalobacter sp. 8-1 TaxID=3131972 RepID=UPI0030ED348E